MGRLRGCAALMGLVLLLSACGEGDDDATTSDAASNAVTVGLRDTALGNVLVDGNGMTLYLFTKDAANKSNCMDSCAATWPPLGADGTLTAGPGVDQAKLSAIDRPDGSKQVAYAGKPLYRYAPDTAAGETKGQGVGGIWYVVGADGEAVTQSPAAGSPSY